jgi:cysteine-rich repeat protein
MLGLLHPATGFAQAVCGNNVIDPNSSEECDDGNTDDCDGCSAFCEDENLLLDSDEDGEIDNCDNCPEVWNPGQEDVDEDGFGDICDEADILGSFVMGLFKATSGFRPTGEGAGRIAIRGFLDAHPPLDGLQAGLEQGLDPDSDGPDEIVLLITVDDGADFQQVFAFSRSECQLRIKGPFLSKVICKSADRLKKAIFRNVPFAPDVYKYAIRGKRLSILPFQRDQVSAVMTVGTIDRPDVIGEIQPCNIKLGPTKERLRCIEPGS